jgi:hypothetical protein
LPSVGPTNVLNHDLRRQLIRNVELFPYAGGTQNVLGVYEVEPAFTKNLDNIAAFVKRSAKILFAEKQNRTSKWPLIAVVIRYHPVCSKFGVSDEYETFDHMRAWCGSVFRHRGVGLSCAGFVDYEPGSEGTIVDGIPYTFD